MPVLCECEKHTEVHNNVLKIECYAEIYKQLRFEHLNEEEESVLHLIRNNVDIFHLPHDMIYCLTLMYLEIK